MHDLFSHWPWWAGAASFALLTVGYWKLTGVPLGASASYGRVADALVDPEEAGRELALSDPEALEAALRAATEAAFGGVPHETPSEEGALDDARASSPTSTGAGSTLPWTAHLTFLVTMILGGLVATILRGGFTFRFDLGRDHAAWFGNGPMAVVVLLVAGMLIGFGTRMSGGCSSGHGLTGCARLQPGSLMGTASFFGAAVAVSFLLARAFE